MLSVPDLATLIEILADLDDAADGLEQDTEGQTAVPIPVVRRKILNAARRLRGRQALKLYQPSTPEGEHHEQHDAHP